MTLSEKLLTLNLTKSYQAVNFAEHALKDVYEQDGETPALYRVEDIIGYILNNKVLTDIYKDDKKLLDESLHALVLALDSELQFEPGYENMNAMLPNFYEAVNTGNSSTLNTLVKICLGNPIYITGLLSYIIYEVNMKTLSPETVIELTKDTIPRLVSSLKFSLDEVLIIHGVGAITPQLKSFVTDVIIVNVSQLLQDISELYPED